MAAAAPAPRIILSDSAFQDRPVTTDQLAGDDEPERIEQAETVEVRTGESRLEHVEVFRVEGVGTSIIGRPRLLSSHRHAAAPRPCLYTLKYEEPLYYQFDYAEDPGHVVINFADSHLWDASTVAALDSVVRKYESYGKYVEVTGLNEASAQMRERLTGRLGS